MWAYSDLLHNQVRPVFAEFIVACALDLQSVKRVGWDAVDLRYRGSGIEIKSAAYLQSWAQEKSSSIRFDIAKKKGWDAATNTSQLESVRSAACYVFCLYPEKDRAKADPIQVPDWQFFVLSTSVINETFRDQGKVALSRIADAVSPVRYHDLRAAVDAALSLQREC